jgi:hypothetical protein
MSLVYGESLKWFRSCFYPNEPLIFCRFFYTSLNSLPSDSSFPSRANHPNPRYNDCPESLVRLNNSFSVNAFSDPLSVFQILSAQVPTISGVMISTGDFVVAFLVVAFLVVAIVICFGFVFS